MSRLFGRVARASAWLALCAALCVFAAQQTFAQGEAAATPQQQEDEAARPGGGIGLLRRLNLTPEQVGQIRSIRQQSEPEGRALLRRLALARRALNQAIYDDEADESLIRQRANELAEAQSAVTLMRAQVEWRIRRVLTPTQLTTLRDLRQQAQRRRMERRRAGDQMTDPMNTFTPRPRRRGADATTGRPEPRPPRRPRP